MIFVKSCSDRSRIVLNFKDSNPGLVYLIFTLVLDPYQETIDTWNRISLLYEQKFMQMDLYNNSYDHFLNMLPPKCRVLEVACGPGNISKYLLGKRPHLHITCSDVSPSMLELAKKNNPGADLLKMDFRDLGNYTSPTDAIICGFGLPYLQPNDASKFIGDCGKLLGNNAPLYLSYVEGDPADSGFKTGSTGLRSYFTYYRKAQITQWLNDSGFTLKETIELTYVAGDGKSEVHCIIIAQKHD